MQMDALVKMVSIVSGITQRACKDICPTCREGSGNLDLREGKWWHVYKDGSMESCGASSFMIDANKIVEAGGKRL